MWMVQSKLILNDTKQIVLRESEEGKDQVELLQWGSKKALAMRGQGLGGRKLGEAPRLTSTFHLQLPKRPSFLSFLFENQLLSQYQPCEELIKLLLVLNVKYSFSQYLELYTVFSSCKWE